MSRSYRALLVFSLGLALLAGPAAAACVDCCPRADVPEAVAAAEACCGDCAPTIDRAPDPAAASLEAPAIGLDSTAALTASAPLASPCPSPRPLASGASSPVSLPRALPAPLRL